MQTCDLHSKPLKIRVIGRSAQALATAAKLVTIAMFERSFYIRDEQGRIACVGREGLGFGPLNAVMASAEFDQLMTRKGAAVSLDSCAAVLWRAPELPPVSSSQLRDGRVLLQKVMREDVRPRGLAVATDDPLGKRAGEGLAALLGWLRVADTDEPEMLPPAVTALVGLGPGLTPSGDDALGGALIALRGLGRPDLADRLTARLLPIARDGTSAISFAHLRAAADGEGAESLHRVLGAMLCGNRPAVAGALAALDGLGHSSGWDALAGVIRVLELFAS